MDAYIAIDVGGTLLRAGLYLPDCEKPLNIIRIATSVKGESTTDRLLNLIQDIWPADYTVKAIGLAAPGFLEPEKGLVVSAPNVPGWKDLPLCGIIQNRFNVPVFLGNDANMAALGEWRFGAGKGHSNLLYLTISTGIGGGIIANNKLLQGSQGLAGELGHVLVQPDGPMCSCGKRGHLEALSSGTGISNYVAEKIADGETTCLAPNLHPSAREIAAAALQGDTLSLQAYQQAGRYLGIAVANFLHILNPSILILGGGVSRSGDLLINPMRASLSQNVVLPEYVDNLIITRNQLGDDPGLLGAFTLAQSSIG